MPMECSCRKTGNQKAWFQRRPEVRRPERWTSRNVGMGSGRRRDGRRTKHGVMGVDLRVKKIAIFMYFG